MKPKLIPLPEAARLLGLTRHQLWMRVIRREVESERLGDRYFIPPTEMARLLGKDKK